MSKYTIEVVRKKDILVPSPKDFEEMKNNYNFIKKMNKSKYGIGAVLSYRDFEAIKAKKKKVFLIALLAFLIAFFLFKNAFALYGTTYLPNGQKAYKNMDTGQVIVPCECKCD
jgi:hypothetical protein